MDSFMKTMHDELDIMTQNIKMGAAENEKCIESIKSFLESQLKGVFDEINSMKVSIINLERQVDSLSREKKSSRYDH